MACMTRCSDIWRGSGSCTMNPSTSSSALSRAIASRSWVSSTVSSKRMSVERNPQRSQAFTLLATYVSEPPSCPTSMAARCGRLRPSATICSTVAAISALIASAVAFPSISFIYCMCRLIFCRFVWPVCAISAPAHLPHHLHGVFHARGGLHHLAGVVKLLEQAVDLLHRCA